MLIATAWETTAWHYFVGYGYSIFAGELVLFLLMPRLYRRLPPESKGASRYNSGTPRRLGIFERVVYTSAWVVGHPEFIAVWLGLKTVQRSFGTTRADKRSLDIFNVYLIGSGFSLAFGVLGGLAITWFANDLAGRAAVVLVVAFIGSLIYALWAGAGTQTASAFVASEDAEGNRLLDELIETVRRIEQRLEELGA